MAMEVMYPQDVLNERLRIPHASFQRWKNVPANLNGNRKSGSKANSRKTSPKPEKKKINAVEEKKGIQGRKNDGVAPVSAPAQLILLRRGESLDSLTAKIKSGGPKSKSPKQKSVDKPTVLPSSGSESAKRVYVFLPPPPPRYAGSAAFLSPPPQSLPLPTFFNKKQGTDNIFDDSATKDLRRLLRLD